MRMNRKGQITVFMIIGILLLAGTFTVLTIRSALERGALEKPPLAPDTASIKNYVEWCLRDTAIDGIYLAGLQGGFADAESYIKTVIASQQNLTLTPEMFEMMQIPPEIVEASQLNIDYSMERDQKFVPVILYDNGNILNPDVAKEISSYIDKNILGCTNFSVLEEKGYEVIYGNPKTEVILTYESVVATLDWNIESRKDETQLNINQFTTSIPANLMQVIQIKDEMVKAPTLDLPCSINLDYITTIPLYTRSNQLNNEIQLITIYSPFIDFKDKEFVFTFAKRCTVEEFETIEEVGLNPIGDLTAQAGTEFNLNLREYFNKPKIIAFTLLSDIPFLTVNETSGVIRHTFTEENKGKHELIILAFEKFNTMRAVVQLEVV